MATEFEVFDTTLRISDDELSGLVGNIMNFIFSETGIYLDENSDEWWEFKYDMLEDEVIGTLQIVMRELEGRRCCDPEYWKEDLKNMAKED